MYKDYIQLSFLDWPENDRCITVYLTGCRIGCLDCHNKGLWNKIEINELQLVKELIMFCERNNTKNITISGGEPFSDLVRLNKILKEIPKDYNICIYTGEDNLYLMDTIIINNYSHIKYLKIGSFKKELALTSNKTDEGFTLASSNQTVYKWDEELKTFLPISTKGFYKYKGEK